MASNEELERRLDRLEKLLAIGLVLKHKQRDQIRLLSLAGFSPSEIASLLGTTPNTVSVSISKMKKGGHLKLYDQSQASS